MKKKDIKKFNQAKFKAVFMADKEGEKIELVGKNISDQQLAMIRDSLTQKLEGERQAINLVEVLKDVVKDLKERKGKENESK